MCKGRERARLQPAAQSTDARLLPFFSAGGLARREPGSEQMLRRGDGFLLAQAAAQTNRHEEARLLAGRRRLLDRKVVPKRGQHLRLGGMLARLVRKALAAVRAFPIARKPRLGAGGRTALHIDDLVPMLFGSAASRKAGGQNGRRRKRNALSLHSCFLLGMFSEIIL